MRSRAEIQFRLRQEAANIYLLVRRPGYSGKVGKLSLPDPSEAVKRLRGTEYAGRIEEIAEQVAAHRFPVLGIELDAGQKVHWRRDYVHGKESGTKYFKLIPYLNFAAVGDHKLVWEFNRHQHLVLLAQAYLLTGRRTFLAALNEQLDSWWEQNPFQRGINWASSLEVAFRTLSWIWLFHLVGNEIDPRCRAKLISGLYQHGRHLYENLSIYFSPNTHLLGEAVALFALGTLFPSFPGAKKWAERTRQIVLEQFNFQVKKDGSHFEQSTYYHVYALDFFLLFYLLADRPPEATASLLRMAEYLHWLLGPNREISFFGDDDGGRLFHPYGKRSRFGRATLATCGVVFNRPEWGGTFRDLAEQAAWWVGGDCLSTARDSVSPVTGSRLFAESGTVFASAGDFRLQMDCGPFGFGGAGHSHSDTLSLTLLYAGASVLVDPGTYTYISDPEERNWFRGSASHNTIRVDGRDQAEAAGPFRWSGKPSVSLHAFRETPQGWYIHAECGYGSIRHERKVLLNEAGLLVLDSVQAPAGEHSCEQIWQLGARSDALFLTTSDQGEPARSFFSPAYAKKEEGRSCVVRIKGQAPLKVAMRLSVSAQPAVQVREAEEIFEKCWQPEDIAGRAEFR